MDFSSDFARYLFRAGQLHAAHGPRQAHVPEMYVTGAISLVNATFARFLHEEMPGDAFIPAALAGWNKALSLHLHMMLIGYKSARELDRGDFKVNVAFFARLRKLVGTQNLAITLVHGERLEHALRKLLNYFPHLRQEIFDQTWIEGERLDATGTPWLEVHPAYRVKPGWRLLLNGKDIAYHGGLETKLKPGDQIDFFPPGR
jgi:molybdopterin converting factor small subunit